MLGMTFTTALATVVFAGGAQAERVCGKAGGHPRPAVQEIQEAPVGMGLANNGGLIELLAADRGATWTLIITLANGPTCLLAAGQDWQPRQSAVPDEPSI